MKLISLMKVVVLLITLWAGIALADESRFIFSDQTVKDKNTKLIWTRDANLGKLEWNGASELVKKLNEKEYAGAKDWRLPSKEELRILILYAMSVGYDGRLENPSPYKLLNKIGFNNVQLCEYLTSNPYEVNTSYTWVISMFDGTERSENKEHDFCVWPLRVGE